MMERQIDHAPKNLAIRNTARPSMNVAESLQTFFDRGKLVCRSDHNFDIDDRLGRKSGYRCTPYVFNSEH
jgi:hypothetical protein